MRRLALIDILPGTEAARIEPIVAFLSGPERFDSFEAIVERTMAFSPNRPVPALRRGIRHNARRLPDGSWTWRWDPVRHWRLDGGTAPDFTALWAAVDALHVPLLLVKGGRSRIVSPENIAELQRRQPNAEVAVIDGAGHSVQGDRPLELAARLAEFIEP